MYFEIGVYHIKYETNLGTLWRSAWQLGAAGIFTIGRRYKKQPSDTYNVPGMIPLRHYTTFDEFNANRPNAAILVGIEMGGTPLSKFAHYKQAVYLLGAEDYGLPDKVLHRCNAVVGVEAINQECYNVAMAGSIVMYHRQFMQEAA